ncbi:response regulator transcription factor [Faecalicatena contorta]|uniref:Stage 0 sporulation protein A homolog n=1 Tax=Faecalicatena contorta TaxID=39482 RepID=A0A316AEN4_9FIRM|nr:response regulator transcription factor [Faecalicatena contorta]PWJ48237.1 DNA-binding response OmpR family regulator [Faecalicatena contorta]SUQ15513.1 DNA-binding response regulator, OmpR family, contains REC and winged-helix (wHTH) domain [Faecalicatena contorta]
MAKILAVDDDNAILTLICRTLEKDGHIVTPCQSADEVKKSYLSYYDLILLDIMMPGTDGIEFCRNIRSQVDCPILFLTAKTEESSIMYGLGSGADDYITKPFGIGELRARVQAHLRREKREKTHAVQVSGVRFDLAGKQAEVEGSLISLTKSEYEISEYLAVNRGQVFSKEQLYEKIFGYDREGDVSAITEHVKNIRAKFAGCGLNPIETVWGIGYKWK